MLMLVVSSVHNAKAAPTSTAATVNAHLRLTMLQLVQKETAQLTPPSSSIIDPETSRCNILLERLTTLLLQEWGGKNACAATTTIFYPFIRNCWWKVPIYDAPPH